MIEIQPDREAMQKFNVHADDMNRLVEAALAGQEVGTLVEGNRRTPIVVRLSKRVVLIWRRWNASPCERKRVVC